MNGFSVLSRLAAVLIPAVLLLPIMVGALWAYEGHMNRDREISEALIRLDRLRAIGAYLPELDRTKPAEAVTSFAHWFLGEGTPAVLTAGLQARLRQDAASKGIDVLQASETQPRTENGLTYLGAMLEMSGTASGVHAMLAQIETSVPFLFVENVAIRSEVAGVTDEKREPTLVLSFEVFGALRATADAPNKKASDASP